MIQRTERFANGALQERVEVARNAAQEVRLKRTDGAGNVMEDRPATAEEEADFVTEERLDGLENLLIQDLANLGITINSASEVRGRLSEIKTNARAQRAAANSTAARLAVLEEQCEMLLDFMAAFINRVI